LLLLILLILVLLLHLLQTFKSFIMYPPHLHYLIYHRLQSFLI
jgi:hypothetical protein